ncbi:MAG: hypothetical protein M2R45_04035 [Verrucomicrobia subdivision 3 bacterium]|nr:hypothetical protein [Limisphaerales bacterium]MCS1416981.1 hypothetical protein [Limisphaerales bacterium]
MGTRTGGFAFLGMYFMNIVGGFGQLCEGIVILALRAED